MFNRWIKIYDTYSKYFGPVEIILAKIKKKVYLDSTWSKSDHKMS